MFLTLTDGKELCMKGIKKVISIITNIEYMIMIFTFAAMVFSYFISVVNRNFIKSSMPWTEEVALYSMTYMALLGTEVGLRDGTQVAVTAVIEKLRGTIRKLADLLKQLVLEVYAFVMLQSGTALFLKQIQTAQTTPVLKAPMWMMYFSLVLVFGIIFLVQGITLIEMLVDLMKKGGAQE